MALVHEDLPHYTYDDYVQWEGKWEIIYGIAYAMAPAPSIEHQNISQKIAGELYNALKGCDNCQALLPVDWQITEDTVVQPDNMVVCGKVTGNKKLLQTPSIVFEVLSPSTSHKDRTVKLSLYEKAGVAYYVIVNPLTLSAEIYWLHHGQYELSQEVSYQTFEFSLDNCTFSLNFSHILESWE